MVASKGTDTDFYNSPSPYWLIKNTKMYRLVGISEKGETFLRDLNNLHSYLRNHFPEIHISESTFNDPSLHSIYKHIRVKNMRHSGTIEEIEGRLNSLKINLIIPGNSTLKPKRPWVWRAMIFPC